jgi:hypothetical protein
MRAYLIVKEQETTRSAFSIAVVVRFPNCTHTIFGGKPRITARLLKSSSLVTMKYWLLRATIQTTSSAALSNTSIST